MNDWYQHIALHFHIPFILGADGISFTSQTCRRFTMFTTSDDGI